MSSKIEESAPASELLAWEENKSAPAPALPKCTCSYCLKPLSDAEIDAMSLDEIWEYSKNKAKEEAELWEQEKNKK
ncbi:hypothetical protein FSARC_11354 [Fusarium sarcochroum]|uniref:Uncharacterized protein n=1 Tax=Fusarium sarcochroum TaxID=1208366 RepID=A0A8H4X049_9HYPO|nr:hypothetical protein FSARC_11354 [Fusarium sarcochroum]